MKKHGFVFVLVPTFALLLALDAAAQCCKGGKANNEQVAQKTAQAGKCQSAQEKCCQWKPVRARPLWRPACR